MGSGGAGHQWVGDLMGEVSDATALRADRSLVTASGSS